MPPRRHSLVVVFDLEMNQPSNRIVQLGAVAGDATTGEVLQRFVRLVDPGEPLARKIADLTGIDPAALREAAPLPAVHAEFATWVRGLGAQRWPNALTWGVLDVPELRAQLETAGGRHDWPLGSRWLDVKAVYQAWRHAHGGSGLGNLERAMRHLDLEFEGRAHDALVDAENTFRAYAALLARQRAR